MRRTLILLGCFMGLVSVAFAQNQRNINNINNSMPNRISMNVTVPKQTQGATFGEKINTGVGKEGAYVVFPNSQAFFITANSIKEIGSVQSRKVNSGIKATGNAISQGAQLIGGVLPGGAIISVAVSKSSDNTVIWEINDVVDGFSLPKDLSDGEYTLILTVKEKATSGLKDTLKTQVRFGIKVESRSYKVYSVAK